MTWHQWHHTALIARRTGLSATCASWNAFSLHARQPISAARFGRGEKRNVTPGFRPIRSCCRTDPSRTSAASQGSDRRLRSARRRRGASQRRRRDRRRAARNVAADEGQDRGPPRDERGREVPNTRYRRGREASPAARVPRGRACLRRTSEPGLPRQADRTLARDATKSPQNRVYARENSPFSTLFVGYNLSNATELLTWRSSRAR